MLKVIRVILHHGKRTLDTYATLDDGSERTMLLSAAAERLGLKGTPEDLALRTTRQDVQTINVFPCIPCLTAEEEFSYRWSLHSSSPRIS